MKRKFLTFLIVAAVIIVIGGIAKQFIKPTVSVPAVNLNPRPADEVSKFTEGITGRSFTLGFTPWPYDYSATAVADTYTAIATHSDIIAHHFDQGIPWQEAKESAKYPVAVEADIKQRLKLTPGGHDVYLAITPISGSREGLALNWGSEGNQPLPGEWADKLFDDADVITAYTNFALAMSDRFVPDYIAYAIEANTLAAKDPVAFEQFLALAARVYPALKAAHPNTPVFVTIQIEEYAKAPAAQKAAITKLLPYTDMIAVSTYPFLIHADPKAIPADWLRKIQTIAPDKPFAVAETGFLAQDLELKTLGVSIAGSGERQDQYVDWILRHADALDAEFVIWFVSRDYDALWSRVESQGVPELFKLWRNTGFIDAANHTRPALERWDQWLTLPRK